MDAWVTFWAVVIVVTLSAFAVLAVIVAIGGWSDLKRLLSKRSEAVESDKESQID